MEQITCESVSSFAAELLAKCDKELTEAERREQLKYATLIQNPKDKIFLSKLLDESSQIRDSEKLADRIKLLIDRYGVPKFFPTSDRILLRAYQWGGYKVDAIAVPIFKKRLRTDTAGVIIDEKRPRLTEHLAERAKKNIGQNVNLLGEVVLGDGEADKRYHHYLEALTTGDINYISVKLSGIYAQMHPLNFVAARRDLADRMATIYRAAIKNTYLDPDGVRRAKFVNLDMEEYKDAYLTLDVFCEVLSKDEFLNLQAGIVVQCYLPDAENLFRSLLAFAHDRAERGGAPLKVRLVKGANQQMEQIVSSLRGWADPVRRSKVEVDAAFMHLVDIALEPKNAEVMHVGIASHNLFTISYAYAVAERNGVQKCVTFEMLEGMAPNLWRTLSGYGVQIILYTPVVKDEYFLNAVSYLVRRLDENTGPENFLSYSFGLKADSKEWRFLEGQFRQALELKDAAPLYTARTQNRITGTEDKTEPTDGFRNEPDTNFDLQVNQQWATSIVERWVAADRRIIGLQIGDREISSDNTMRYEDRMQKGVVSYEMARAGLEDVKQILAVADEHRGWSEMSLEERTVILNRAADNLHSRRGDLIGCMASVTGKTITEGDVEVSEAIDFCRFYPHSMREFVNLEKVDVTPKGVVLVISPWNFPLAIPVGGVAAALSGGNRVILKPATVAAPVMWEAARCLWDAGVPRSALQVVITDTYDTMDYLCSSPIVKHIILTGGTDTAQRIAEKNPDKPLSAETGGKNVMILTSSGDRDKAIQNAVSSAFGNAGQKCSACSLLLVESDVYEDPAFAAKLRDAALSMHTGSPWDLGTMVGPMITNKNEKLLTSINNPVNKDKWLVAPEFLDEDRYILRPTILWDVDPTQYEARTELFAPLLAVGCFNGLDEAIEIVNSLDYGLTSGLQSLDEREIERWRDSVVAGNLYINRGITGAIVNRQPFGGMKLSAFGAGIKAGGVNYVANFVNFSSEATHSNYKEAYQMEFAHPRDVNNIKGEQNLFRYLPLSSMVLRVMGSDSMEAVKMATRASIATRTPLTISIEATMPEETKEQVSMLGCEVVEENMWEFIASMPSYERIRTLSPNIPMEIYRAAVGLSKYIASSPPLACGRVELLHYLKEQSIAYEYHRYGSITEEF